MTTSPTGPVRLDANIVSALMSSRQDANVAAWYDSLDTASVLIPAVVHYEVRNGLGMLPPGVKRSQTTRKYEQVRRLTAGIVDFDEAAAEATAEFMEHRRRHGRRMDDQLADAQIAGTAAALSRKSGRVTLATRNLGDFALLAAFAAVDVLDPFTGRRG